MAHITDGRSYRWIARDLGISKNTVDRRKRQQTAALPGILATAGEFTKVAGIKAEVVKRNRLKEGSQLASSH